MAPPPIELSSSAEAAWQTLRQHDEWAKGFWLAWVFTDHPPTADELRRRLAAGGTRPMRVFDLAGATDVPAILRGLLADDPAPQGHVWVRCSGATGGPDARADQRQAWTELHLRLNERREALRQRLPAGLVLAGPAGFKAAAREAAPDLWSIRSLVLEAEPPVPFPLQSDTRPERPEPLRAPASAKLARRALQRALRAEDRAAEAVARTRLAQAWLDEGAPAEARTEAARAVERAAAGADKARALGVLAEAEDQLGDHSAALAHYRQALQDAGDAGGSDAVWWAVQAARIARDAGRPADALSLGQDAVRRARPLGPDHTRELAVALYALGRAHRDLGDLDAARDAFTESLGLRRRLRDTLGDSPQVLRDLSIGLDGLGKVSRELGDLNAARQAFTESIQLSRQLRDTLGDTPQVIRDLSIGLENLGRTAHELGDLDAARQALAESIELARLLRATHGDTPLVIRDLSVGLDYAGKLSLDLGDLDGARQAFTESIQLSRQLRDKLGDTPQVIRDISVGLDNLGRVAGDLGDLDAARDAFTESLALRRQLRDALGDTPQVIHDLVSALALLALVSDGGERTALGQEAIALAMRRHEQHPTPSTEGLLAALRKDFGSESGDD